VVDKKPQLGKVSVLSRGKLGTNPFSGLNAKAIGDGAITTPKNGVAGLPDQLLELGLASASLLAALAD
jgi:hypothetical protein